VNQANQVRKRRTKVSQRFSSNLALALAGAVVVVSSQAFSSTVTGWLTFGVSLGALALLAVIERERIHDRAQRLLDLGIGVLAIWSAVASVIYNGRTLTWLSLAEGLAYVGLAIAGLGLHEVEDERAVHALEDMRARRTAQPSEEMSAAA
jgi:hypothetical protein